jgi:hypothetical protein
MYVCMYVCMYVFGCDIHLRHPLKLKV